MSYLLGEDDARLDTVKKFRDEVLAGSTIGQEIIKIYNRNSSKIIDILESSPAAKAVAKKVLELSIPAMQMLTD